MSPSHRLLMAGGLDWRYRRTARPSARSRGGTDRRSVGNAPIELAAGHCARLYTTWRTAT